MEHLRLDPRFRRQPKPKKAGWLGREVYLFLLQVSADYDLRGRLGPSRDVEWLADEWMTSRSDEEALEAILKVSIPELIKIGIEQATGAGLLVRDGDELVLDGWEDFYKPSKSDAQRSAEYRSRKSVTDVTGERDASQASLRHENHERHATPHTPHHPPTPPTNDVRTAADPVSAPGALTVPAVVAGAQPERRAVARVTAPDTPPEEWEGLDFWRWAQDRRQATGYTPERPPHPRKLSSWWSETRGVVEDVARIKAAFYRFGDDEYWGTTDPPYPFQGFMTQWERFVPAQEASDAA